MNRLTNVRFQFAVGSMIALACVLLLASASASQTGGVIVVNPSSYDFGGVVERVQEVTTLIEVRNNGTSDITIQELKMMGQNAADFHFSAEWPFTLPPGDQRRIVVNFGPSTTGPKEAILRIVSNASNQPQLDVPLKGNGLPLAGLGQITASAMPNNAAPHAGDLIIVEVKVNMNGANPPAHLMRNYQATLSWDPAVLQFNGFTLGDWPWTSPASIGLANGTVDWFDAVFDGVGGSFVLIRFKFKVIGQADSSTNLNLSFSRMEGDEVENLLPILIVNPSSVKVEAEKAPPDIDVSPASHDYGPVVYGRSVSRKFIVSNKGNENLTVNSITLQGTNADQFTIVSGGAPFTLASDESREVVVSFKPTSEGTKAAALVFNSNDPDELFFYVTLTGSVLVPDIHVEPSSLNFGDVPVGSTVSKTLVISNKGTAALQLTQFGLDGHQLQFAYNTGFLAFLLPGQSGNVTVSFRPSTEGPKSAKFIIHSNDPDEVSVEIPLGGNGVRQPAR
jgi:hypothetical protein